MDSDQNYSCQVRNEHSRCYLKRAEGEIDEVAGVATAALHTFIYQHGEDHFVDAQQGNQYQCRSGQAEGRSWKHTVARDYRLLGCKIYSGTWFQERSTE